MTSGGGLFFIVIGMTAGTYLAARLLPPNHPLQLIRAAIRAKRFDLVFELCLRAALSGMEARRSAFWTKSAPPPPRFPDAIDGRAAPGRAGDPFARPAPQTARTQPPVIDAEAAQLPDDLRRRR